MIEKPTKEELDKALAFRDKYASVSPMMSDAFDTMQRYALWADEEIEGRIRLHQEAWDKLREERADHNDTIRELEVLRRERDAARRERNAAIARSSDPTGAEAELRELRELREVRVEVTEPAPDWTAEILAAAARDFAKLSPQAQMKLIEWAMKPNRVDL